MEGRAPRRRGGELREHHRRGEGRERLLLHLGQRRAGDPRHPRRQRDSFSARYVSWQLSAPDHRPQHADLGRRVPRPRRHPPRHGGAPARSPARRRVPDPPRVRLRQQHDALSGHGQDRQRGHPHPLHRGHDPACGQEQRHPVCSGHRDRRAAPHAQGQPRQRVSAHRRVDLLQVHEDDHHGEAAQQPARPDPRGDG